VLTLGWSAAISGTVEQVPVCLSTLANHMKNTRTKVYCVLALATWLVGASLPFAAASETIIQDFSTNADGAGVEWGPGSATYDSTVGNPAGSLLLTMPFKNSSDSPGVHYICAGGGSPWVQPVRINFSQYQSLQFDIKWDPTSDITVAQFNDPSTWPLTLTNSLGHSAWQPETPAGYLNGSIPGLEIAICGGPAGYRGPTICTTNIPEAAASGWVHIVIPINPAQAQIDGVNGIVFHKWIHQESGLSAEGVTARFWIDNVRLEGLCCPPLPIALRVEPVSPAGGYWLIWPRVYRGFEVQATTNLLTGPWYNTGLNTNCLQVGESVQALVPAPSPFAPAQCYWRLHQPAP
jgi:hypothetical protein